ncbi:hypothetical protein SS50377_23527 [Spironucleus salmonicida]|uniref:Transmembrane protein n=1 Tax=Spironucleus salmonicida TaxID=348837 RepID=A0A9P8RYJ7_9EUKA|nr:hypothetical protein SS50377_23527 [Spironucleus salmonicida]
MKNGKNLYYFIQICLNFYYFYLQNLLLKQQNYFLNYQFGHDFVSDSLIGRFQQEVICSIPSQFDSEPTLHIEITAQGEQNVDDQQLGLGIIELENIVGGMENVKTQ